MVPVTLPVGIAGEGPRYIALRARKREGRAYKSSQSRNGETRPSRGDATALDQRRSRPTRGVRGNWFVANLQQGLEGSDDRGSKRTRRSAPTWEGYARYSRTRSNGSQPGGTACPRGGAMRSIRERPATGVARRVACASVGEPRDRFANVVGNGSPPTQHSAPTWGSSARDSRTTNNGSRPTEHRAPTWGSDAPDSRSIVPEGDPTFGACTGTLGCER